MPSLELCVTGSAGGKGEENLRDLAQRARTGDEQAFVSLAKRLEPTIRSWAARLSPDADSADDLTQLTLIRLHERVGQFDQRSRVTSWLYRMMHNLAADRRRADARRMTRDRHAAAGMLVAAAPEVEDAASDERLSLLLASYHAVLTAREREVFELVDLRGTPASEAAARLRIAPATIRVLLLRARRKLRTLMLNDLPLQDGGMQE